jgi:hypothetical protein
MWIGVHTGQTIHPLVILEQEASAKLAGVTEDIRYWFDHLLGSVHVCNPNANLQRFVLNSTSACLANRLTNNLQIGRLLARPG